MQNINFDQIKNILDRMFDEGLICNKKVVFDQLKGSVFRVLDEFFAPVVVKYIHLAALVGATEKERYKNFFLDENLNWSKNVINMFKKEKILMGHITNIVYDKINSLQIFLNNYFDNYSNIQNFFGLDNHVIKRISDSLSDNHNHLGGCIKVTFVNNKKLIYKPRNADSDILFNEYINILNLHGACSIKTVKILNISNNSSWHEYKTQTKTNNTNKLKRFYINFGVMLSILDSLNYIDGHSENFISSYGRFILLDSETLFTNYSYYVDKGDFYKDLSFTGMIYPKNSKFRFMSALQGNDKKVYFPIDPYVVNDLSSKIRINYRRFVKNKNSKSIPFRKNIRLKKYIDDIVYGATIGYSSIKDNKARLINLVKNSTTIKFRQIKRPTLYYIWLIHKALHPLNNDIDDFLDKNMNVYNNNVVQYEKNCILTNNIPIFYNQIGNKNLILYDDSIIEKDHYFETPLYWFLKKISDICNEKFIERRINEIRKII